MRDNLIYEVLIVGLITVFIYSILYRIIGTSQIQVVDYNKMLFTAFITGGSLHFLFEILGANEYWCRQTYKLT
jgi:hypothetical protein